MWLAMQAPNADDFVVATGESHTVRELCEVAFSRAGLDYREFVTLDPRYLRPAEVDALRGDATKARTTLGWKPSVTFRELIHMMVDSDLALAREEAAVQQHRSQQR
jgi:GDPmannose 4,6-dehydratase